MAQPYRHTQVGRILIAVVALATLLAAPFVAMSDGVLMLPVVLGAPVVGILLFGWLTVEIANGYLRFWFGIGLIRRRIPLDRIAGIACTRSSWLYGWGIHLTPRGWLYNIGGLDAVEIRLTSGRTVLLGTDEPDALRAAIQQSSPISS